MSLAEKVKRYGVLGTLKAASHRMVRVINRNITYFLRLLPINQSLIVFESEGDLADNAFALYNYMKNSGRLKNRKIVWLVDNTKQAQTRGLNGIIFVEKDPFSIRFSRDKYLATCKWFIYDHRNMINDLPKRDGQLVIYLSHGCGLKRVSQPAGFKSNLDRCYVTGKLYIPLLAEAQSCPPQIVKDLGYPRLDCFFEGIANEQKSFIQRFHFTSYSKILLWMPTFRKSTRDDLAEKYFVNETGLPILEQEEELHNFDLFLRNNNLLCLLKLHHLQAKLPAFKYNFSNMIILRDEEIEAEGLQLYQVIKLTDVLITDYSSVSNDYLLLDKPIIYTLDDFDKYKASRGFKVSDPLKYYIGYHVLDENELEKSIIDYLENGDRYKDTRNCSMAELHTYRDGNAALRICEDLGL